jgi:peroxiredoxin
VSGGRITPWAPLRPTAFLWPRARELPPPLEDPRCRLYELGRHALWHGLLSMGLGDGDEVLVPAYHHGSDVGALDAAKAVCRFYEATEELEPDEDELERLLTPRTRALYLIHYLGFAQDGPRWRSWCDERGLMLIEDVAMAWPAELDGRPLGSWGEIAFFSPWKPYGLPDCGALICSSPPEPVPVRRGLQARALALSMGKWIGQRSRLVASLRSRTEGPVDFDPVHEFDLWDRDAGPSAISLFLRRRLCRRDVAAVRRENHRRLVELLGDRVARPFDRPQPGACPFAVPVWSEDKVGLLRHLSDRGVSALDVWAVPHPLLPVDEFPEAARRRASIVGLPVHQELRPHDLERIAASVLEYEGMRGDGSATTLVSEGDKAPDFELQDQDGRTVRLADFEGRTVVLYFYPEADTPGCTKQACGIRDRHAELTGNGGVVLGISPDKPDKLRDFADKHGLPFTLLSDSGGRVAQRYGVWVRRPGLLPRKENERTTFVVGPDGRVQSVFRAVDPAGHDQLIADALSPSAPG